LNNEITEYPLVNILNNQGKVWLTWISNNKSLTEGIIAIVDNLEGYCSIYDEAGQFLGNVELNETVKFRQPITLKFIAQQDFKLRRIRYTSYLSGIFPSNVKYFDKLHNLFTNLDYSENQNFYRWNHESCHFDDFELEFLNL
jgi:hypothetical protein